jgi:hypothetical protein
VGFHRLNVSTFNLKCQRRRQCPQLTMDKLRLARNTYTTCQQPLREKERGFDPQKYFPFTVRSVTYATFQRSRGIINKRLAPFPWNPCPRQSRLHLSEERLRRHDPPSCVLMNQAALHQRSAHAPSMNRSFHSLHIVPRAHARNTLLKLTIFT